MPQIAQQDYLHFKQSMPIEANIDCELIAFLVRGIESGTIWDMIITVYPDHDFDDSNAYIERVCRVSSFDGEFNFWGNVGVSYSLRYSSANYSGLAAIQRVLLARGETVDYVPNGTVTEEGFLKEDATSDYLSVNGKKIKVTLDGDTIVAIAISDEDAPEGSIEITEQDAQKLVGIVPV